jgi:hypothetical protein
MVPLINEADFLVADLGSECNDFFSTSCVINKTENTIGAPLNVPSTRRVSFAHDVTSHDVMCRKEYTAEEMKATWYDRCFLRQMKDCARSEARLAEIGVLVEGGDVSFRGLEAKTSKGLRRKRQSRMNAYAAVFFEIDSQQDLGMCDEDAIADAYYTYSEPCLTAAHMIAVRDAEDAKIALQSMKSEMRFGANLLWSHATPPTDVLVSSAA